jgi:hypothetical protein
MIPTAIVRNVSTRGRACPCGSWLNHWERRSGEVAGVCAASSCLQPAADGARVVLEGESGLLVVPLCREHLLQFGLEIPLKPWTALVPAVAEDGCGAAAHPVT